MTSEPSGRHYAGRYLALALVLVIVGLALVIDQLQLVVESGGAAGNIFAVILWAVFLVCSSAMLIGAVRFFLQQRHDEHESSPR